MNAGGTLEEKIKANKEWSRAIVFSDKGDILATTFQPQEGEIPALLTVFNDYDTTVGGGVTIAGEHFDVHRFYETLIYGRRGDSETGEGFCICKVIGAKNKAPVFALITYGFPTLSARAAPQLREFCKANVEPNY